MVKKQQVAGGITLLQYSDAKQIPSLLAKKLGDLTLRQAGEMRGRFSDNRNIWYDYSSTIMVAMHSDIVIGWVMLSFSAINEADAELMTYVRRSYRRKGIGSMLVRSICDTVDKDSTIGVYYTADHCTPKNVFYMVKIADPRFKQLSYTGH